MAPILELEDLHKVYPGGVHALQGVNLTVQPGEFVVLLGLSGSGKSTLLRAINRLIDPTSGRIRFDGADITDLPPKDLRQVRRHIGMIFQQFNLIRNLTARTNVLTGRLGYLDSLQSVFLPWNRDIRRLADECLARVNLTPRAGQLVRNLSGGQQQRVAIARALMQNPRIILADEPVASLDPATADTVMRYLGELNRKDGMTVLCSLHFLSLARKYGGRVVALKDGQIVFDGAPSEIDAQRFKEIYGEDAEEVEIR
jgi:phosphonate transport system ATP-binding protein